MTYHNTFSKIDRKMLCRTSAKTKLTRAGPGGCLNTPPPSGFSPTVFGTAIHTFYPHTLWKFQSQVTQGQVTRSRQVTSPQKNLECSSSLHRMNDHLETFSNWYPYQYLWNVYLGISISVTKGQVNFATSPLKVNKRKMKGASFARKPFKTL